MSRKEYYAISILNKVFDKLSITGKEKVELCDKFVQEIRKTRK